MNGEGRPSRPAPTTVPSKNRSHRTACTCRDCGSVDHAHPRTFRRHSFLAEYVSLRVEVGG